MSAKASANIAVTIGNVSLGSGATAILGTNKVGSDVKTQAKSVQEYKNDLFVSEPSSVRAELINTKGSLTEGTCQWILHNGIYRSWLEAQDSGLLWISGGPGRGKTMLSIFLTQEWESLPDCAVLYVFCGDNSTSDEITIMRSLLYQVLSQVPSMVDHVKDCLGTEERTKRTLSSRGDLWAMFASMLKDPKLGPVLSLIDGLDECHLDSNRWLLNNLRQVFDKESRSRLSPSNPFRLAIVSRDMAGLRSYPRLNLETETGVIAQDVSRVIDAKMKEHNLFSELDKGLIREVKTTLQDRSDGTFLWVGFAIQELLSIETKTEMRLALDAIPRDLGALYSKILLRIKGPMKEKIVELLHWVTLACRALTASELAVALDVDAQTILDLVAMSRSLLTLIEKEIWETTGWALPGPTIPETLDASKVVVKVVHASVSDFLKSNASEDILPSPGFHIHAEEMELQITQRCLRELEILLVRRDIPYGTFSRYAALSWLEHARCCDERLERLLDSDIAFVQNERGRLIRSRWWNIYKPQLYGPKITGRSLLHVCSAFGLFPLAKRLLQDMALTGSQVDEPDSRGWTALCYALHTRHITVAQLLVDHGASLTRATGRNHFMDDYFEDFMPIHMAMGLGAEVAKPFLKKTLESIGPSSRDTALECSLFRKAAALGDKRLIRILCANGATLDSHIAGRALKSALRHGGGLTLINLFLRHGASTSNLDLTVIPGHGLESIYDLVKTLLDYGMDPNSSGGRRPLLHHATRSGPDLVKLLLDCGAHLNALDDNGRPALFHALDDDKIGSVAMLLNRGADLTIKDSNDDTALHWAIKRRNPKGVELLLQHGHDANIRDGDGRTALTCLLSSWWHISTVKVLLKHGADVNSRDEDWGEGSNSPFVPGGITGYESMFMERTPIVEAVRDRSIEVVRLLLQLGVDVNVQANRFDLTTPLTAAISNRHVDMIQMLLEHGADPNGGFREFHSPMFDMSTRWKGTPLDRNQWYNDDKRVQIAELLLQKGGHFGRGSMTGQKRPWDTFACIKEELERL